MAVGRVNLALVDDRFVWTPTWTRVDSIDNLVKGFDISRGKQTEADITDTSTATVYLNDRDGYFDPANVSSMFAGYLGRQILLQVYDPAAEEWVQQARMWIETVDFDINPATRDGTSIVSNVQLQCIDIFGLLSRLSMDVTEVTPATKPEYSVPSNRVFGNTVPAGNEGVVFYEDSSAGDGSGFDDRINQVLADCGIPDVWSVVFTGNIDLLEGLYDVGDSPMLVLGQAVEAEMPGVGQHYSDKFGRYVAHGRAARFHPLATWTSIGASNAIRDAVWKFREWKVGDGAAIQLDSDRGQIRPPLGWTYSETKVRNVGYAYPKQTEVGGKWVAFPEDLKPGQMYETPGLSAYDRRVWSAENILVKAGTTTLNTGAEEALAYATFWATVLEDADVIVSQVTLKSIALNNPQADVSWAVMLNADISDVINVDPNMDMVTVTFNLSPKSYYDDDMGLLGGT